MILNEVFQSLQKMSDDPLYIKCKNKVSHDKLLIYAKQQGFIIMPSMFPREDLMGSSIFRLGENEEEGYMLTYPIMESEKNEQWIDAHLVTLGIDPELVGWTLIDE